MFVFYIYAAVLLGILIIVHEIGHFVAARLAGVTVERFSIGFGPRILTMKRGGTEYAISLIPLGGYVKMAGMDPTEDNGDEPPGPNTLAGSPRSANRSSGRSKRARPPIRAGCSRATGSSPSTGNRSSCGTTSTGSCRNGMRARSSLSSSAAPTGPRPSP